MKAWHCQAALALTQTAFCVGSVYLKSSLRQVFRLALRAHANEFMHACTHGCKPGTRDLQRDMWFQVSSANGQVFHPIIYAFLREATAGPIMCGLAWFSTGAQSTPVSEFATSQVRTQWHVVRSGI